MPNIFSIWIDFRVLFPILVPETTTSSSIFRGFAVSKRNSFFGLGHIFDSGNDFLPQIASLPEIDSPLFRSQIRREFVPGNFTASLWNARQDREFSPNTDIYCVFGIHLCLLSGFDTDISPVNPGYRQQSNSNSCL